MKHLVHGFFCGAVAFAPPRTHLRSAGGRRFVPPPAAALDALLGGGLAATFGVAATSLEVAPTSFEVAATSLEVATSPLAQTADDVAGAFFGASLFPWLAMLYWLGHSKVQAPEGVQFGLQFLLVFVFASIPAAIFSGLLYGVSLADCDYLHGSAESLLAITNCVLVLGFRDALASRTGAGRLQKVASALGALALASALAAGLSGAQVHTPWLGLPSPQLPGWAEPANALSIPTWVIHTSSLVEWLVAMGLCWRYAAVSEEPKWKGVTWGMLPLHTSGIIACTYHLFYNDAALAWCVALQAACTCLGNTTLAFAVYRLAAAKGWDWGDLKSDAMSWLPSDEGAQGSFGNGGAAARGDALLRTAAFSADAGGPAAFSADASSAVALVGWEDLGDAWAEDDDDAFVVKLAALSIWLAVAVKYAPALIPASVEQGFRALGPEALVLAAAAVIAVPTALNVAKWQSRSADDADDFDF
ncbi:hypothetical protein M885DRAFT_478242 [Pelagophyceae sp. CCMP2097]|nr:hypothetical protein M885DRAFT_478242 [Pelagophyceae sp. CCMP2097]